MDITKEKKLFRQGYSLIAGVDEAGRGALAGPVVAACVIGGKTMAACQLRLAQVDDSKKLTAGKREKLFAVIAEIFTVSWAAGSEAEIEKLNIRRASLLAMKRAVFGAKLRPEIVLVDGNAEIPSLSFPQEAIVRGDGCVQLIAAASIVAKVVRDRIMRRLDRRFPGYGFSRHKGYATAGHTDALRRLGPCPIHRRSFYPVSAYGADSPLVRKRNIDYNKSR